MKENKRNK